MNRYLVSFMHQKSTGTAMANCEIRLDKPVRSMADVEVLAGILRRQGLNSPVVIAFSRFDSDTADGGTTR